MEERRPAEVLRDVDEAFTKFCGALKLSVIAVRAARHGSITWEAGTQDEFNRYLTLSLTDIEGADVPAQELLMVPPSGTHLDVSVRKRVDLRQLMVQSQKENGAHLLFGALTVGADNGSRFVTQTPWKWVYRNPEEVARTAEGGWLSQLLETAYEAVLQLHSTDFVDEYVVPRGPVQAIGASAGD